MMIRKGIKPGFRIGFDLPGGQEGFRQVFPFRRSWIAIAVLVLVDVVFFIPAIGTFTRALTHWTSFDTLFDLVIAIFLSAWLLGWMIVPLLITFILVMMLAGREVIRIRKDTFEILFGVPGIGVTAIYNVKKMRNLRVEHPVGKSGTSWRGSHFVFDYGANPVAVGSAVDHYPLDELKNQIQMVNGSFVRRGEARADEITSHWVQEVSAPPEHLSAEAAEIEPVNLSSLSSLALIVANLVPVAGTLFLDWNLSDVMVLYWAESAVIGFFNLCKIVVIDRWMSLLAAPFFLGHFGGFMAVHFLFIYTIFVVGFKDGMVTTGDLGNVGAVFFLLWPAIAALFVSHAFSFFKNFLGRREFLGRSIRQQMSEPYSRIIFMHLVIIFGGGLAMFLQEPAPVILLVIGLKIYFDLKAHLKERESVTP